MRLTRREVIYGAVAAVGTAMEISSMTHASAAVEVHTKPEPFRYCLNTSTIKGQKLSLAEEVEIAARAGYHAIEPWIQEIEHHVETGGSLKDLSSRIKDHGLTVESGIGFAEWIVDDDARRAKGLERARHDMDLLAQIGGKRLAAPPMGATDQANLDLRKAAERYRVLLDIGDQIGVVPQAEVWGFSQCLKRLGEAALVAIESGHPHACILPDVYHLYKGGSDVVGLKLLGSQSIHVFHINDYPSEPSRATITDAQRVYPGDGIAPLKTVFHLLRDMGYTGILSVELFNAEYWKQDAFTVAKTALDKMRAVVQQSVRAGSSV